MILKNLLRRKGRTLLTILGISLGVAAIITLGALAEGFRNGYNSMLSGSRADLVLSQPNTYDISLAAVDEDIEKDLLAMPEVEAVSAMLQGIAITEGSPFFFVFGYPPDSFALPRFKLTAGVGLTDHSLTTLRGRPLLLGSAAAETLHKAPGDTMRITDSSFRVVGIYETGDAFEDSGAVVLLDDAQEMLGRPRLVSLFYIKLKEAGLRDRFTERAERLWRDLSVSGTNDYASKQSMAQFMQVYVWVIAGMAVVLGGVSMMNAQLMAVFERTREIGVLRAVGWSRRQVLWLIFGESLLICFAGGVVGVALGWAALAVVSSSTVMAGASPAAVTPALVAQALVVVLLLGLFGGLYPAWRASRLQPIEALRYESGSSGRRVARLPVGDMAVQSLWQRSTRTSLTLLLIGLTVGAIMLLDALVRGIWAEMGSMINGAQVEIMIRQANISDTGLSQFDQRIGLQIATLPGVQHVSGIAFTAYILPTAGMMVLQGYAPGEFAIRRFHMVEGESIFNNHQIMLGRQMADALHTGVGETVELMGVRYRVTGIYETGVGWEEMGGVITLRDIQTLTGQPRKVMMMGVKVSDPALAAGLVAEINRRWPQVSAALTGDFMEQMPDRERSDGMLSAISLLTIVVGGLGVMNTMLMAVLERTREVGVLRALGWKRRAVLGLILREALLLGSIGGLLGIGVAFALSWLMLAWPALGPFLDFIWAPEVFIRALGVALLLGAVGGLYPAFRATRLQPVEALRYE